MSGAAWVQLPRSVYDEMTERIEMLSHIALSAIALKISIESGFPPTLHALNRDLALYQVRFGGSVEMIGRAALAMERPAIGKAMHQYHGPVTHALTCKCLMCNPPKGGA